MAARKAPARKAPVKKTAAKQVAPKTKTVAAKVNTAPPKRVSPFREDEAEAQVVVTFHYQGSPCRVYRIDPEDVEMLLEFAHSVEMAAFMFEHSAGHAWIPRAGLQGIDFSTVKGGIN
jgi:hypothetical protein